MYSFAGLVLRLQFSNLPRPGCQCLHSHNAASACVSLSNQSCSTNRCHAIKSLIMHISFRGNQSNSTVPAMCLHLSMHTLAESAPSAFRIPFRPQYTSLTCSGDGSMVMITSTPADGR